MSRRNISAKDARYNTNGSRFWTQAEFRLLKELWGNSRYSIAGIAAELSKISEGRTPTSVSAKAHVLKLPRRVYERPRVVRKKPMETAPTPCPVALFEDHPEAPARERPWREGRYSADPLRHFRYSACGSAAAMCADLGDGDFNGRERMQLSRRRAKKRQVMAAE